MKMMQVSVNGWTLGTPFSDCVFGVELNILCFSRIETCVVPIHSKLEVKTRKNNVCAQLLGQKIFNMT
jgi:hypothetical protein